MSAPNQGHEYNEEAGPAERGRRLLDHLAGRHTHSSREEWIARISEGRVFVNGRPAAPGLELLPGMKIQWRRPPWVEPDADLNWAVAHEDASVLAVFKPAGLPTLPGANFLEHTLLHQVRLRFPAAAPVHRLGRWTSGLVLCALTSRAAGDLTTQFARREAFKLYRALATGSPERDAWDITTPIGPVFHPRLGTVHAASPAGRNASSRVVVRERRDGAFVCDVRIDTGRPHQVRIHLAASGHPLVGDPLYGLGGLPLPGTLALPGDPGYHLHAMELGFRHPKSHDSVRVLCPPPAGPLCGVVRDENLKC